MHSGPHWLLSVVLIAAFSGCERHVELIRETERIEQKVAELRDVRAAATSSRQFSRLRVVDGPYTGIVPAPAIAHLIPTQFLADDGVTLPVAGVVDTAVLAARIEVATGLRVRFVGAALDPETEQAALSNGMFGLSAVDALAPVGGIWTGSLVDLLDG